MAEWSNAAVLKTVDLHGSGGSNPSLSAENKKQPASFTIVELVFFLLTRQHSSLLESDDEITKKNQHECWLVDFCFRVKEYCGSRPKGVIPLFPHIHPTSTLLIPIGLPYPPTITLSIRSPWVSIFTTISLVLPIPTPCKNRYSSRLLTYR